MVNAEESQTIEKSKLLLVEGPDDLSFFDALLCHLNRQDIDVRSYSVSLVKGFCPVPVRVYAHFGHGFRTSQNTSVAHGQNPIRHR